MNFYYIYANIDGAKKWHLVYDKRPGLYFVQSDFEEDEYDIEMYREEFPQNEVIEIPNPNEIKHPLGICDDHMKIWDRMDCPLCDSLFLYDRLKLALDVIEEAVCVLSEMPEIAPGIDDEEKDEANRGKACIMLSKYLDYARSGMSDEKCSCDEIGEGRCPKHGWEIFAESLRLTKESK